jgi:hypothetical protein
MAPLTDKPFSAQVQMAMKHNHSELFHLNLYRDQAIHHRINHLMLIRTAGHSVRICRQHDYTMLRG